jgi:hypothetical protein
MEKNLEHQKQVLEMIKKWSIKWNSGSLKQG